MNISDNKYKAIIDQIESLGKNKEKIEKALRGFIVKIQERADEEKKSINAILSILAGNSETPPQKNKKIKEKRIKLTDEQILGKVKEILAESEELPKSKIASEIGITNPRFEKFYKTYSHLFGQKGKFKKKQNIFGEIEISPVILYYFAVKKLIKQIFEYNQLIPNSEARTITVVFATFSMFSDSVFGFVALFSTSVVK